MIWWAEQLRSIPTLRAYEHIEDALEALVSQASLQTPMVA